MQEIKLVALDLTDVRLIRNLCSEKIKRLQDNKNRDGETIERLAKIHAFMENTRWALNEDKLKAVITIISPLIEVVDEIENQTEVTQ